MPAFGHQVSLPNRHSADVAPSGADVALPAGTVAVVVLGTIDDVVLQDAAGTNRTYPSAAITRLQGVIPGNWAKIIDTGTSATDITAWYYVQ